jgi:hypothetical protein
MAISRTPRIQERSTPRRSVNGGPPTGFPPLTSRLAACFFADMRGVPARLPCRTAPRTPVPAIPPADGPLACQCRTSTPVPAIPLVPASPSTYRARAGPLARVVARAPTPVPAHNTIARKHVPISTGNRARNWRAPTRNSLHFRYRILFTLRRDGKRQENKKRAKVKVC